MTGFFMLVALLMRNCITTPFKLNFHERFSPRTSEKAFEIIKFIFDKSFSEVSALC